MLGVQWTSDSQNLLFAIKGGQVHLYDYEGNFMNKVSMWSGPGSEMGEIAALKYYLNRTSVPCECHVKSVPNIIALCSHNNLCAVLSRDSDQAKLSLCTGLSTNVDTRLVPLDAAYVHMNGQYAVIASRHSFVLCPYVAGQASFLSGVSQKKERFYHVDDTPAGVKHDTAYDIHHQKDRPTQDAICCITCSDRFLVIGRESGTLQRYTLPDVTLVQRNSTLLSCRPSTLALNCDSTCYNFSVCTRYLREFHLFSSEILRGHPVHMHDLSKACEL
ncbi:WD repeat-containing protein 35-like [Diaphorina citri]|uniref:WD repeat-containing protein 35-like n=1 Tax=Diaphorina citri TaxID=121845 RepID=A0A3Q0JII7_DIACI|nr:WD repeat-containing protein 35-like [Diaphorina citri]